jgi:hypothetical protein
MSEDPPRLVDGADPELRGALEAARADVPDARRLARIAAGITAAGLAAGSGTAAAAAPVAGWKVLAVLGVLGAATLGGVVAVHESAAPPSRTAPSTPASNAPSAPPAASVSLPLAAPEPSVSSAPAPTHVPSAARSAPAPNPEAELALLDEAQRALAGEPARALALAAEHGRRFPDGILAQEREVLAVTALARLGRIDEARARAGAFHRRWPSSAHGRRIDALLGD